MLGNKQKIKMKIDKYTANNDNLCSNIYLTSYLRREYEIKNWMTLESSLEQQRSNQPIPKEINSKYSLE